MNTKKGFIYGSSKFKFNICIKLPLVQLCVPKKNLPLPHVLELVFFKLIHNSNKTFVLGTFSLENDKNVFLRQKAEG